MPAAWLAVQGATELRFNERPHLARRGLQSCLDLGPLSSALHLEHMTLLWIKMSRVQGKGSNFVWAMLER